MRQADLSALRNLYLNARRATFTWEPPERFKLEDFDTSTQDELILVADIADEIVGFASIYLVDSFIHNLFVDFHHHGRGVGTKLLNEALAQIPLPARLKCGSRNLRALGFYDSHGWHRVAEEIGPEGPYWLMSYG